MGAESEQVLRDLCSGSFLSLWSIPNPFNDDGVAKRGEGKEICDLLVVFGDDVIIFSDKSCMFANTAPSPDKPNLHWDRWYRRAITKSVDQVFGAERWIRKFPERVFLNAKCTEALNVALPPAERARFHRIVVALGAGSACRQYYGGGSGSLMISAGALHLGGAGAPRPFTLTNEILQRGFVHVFDDVTLKILLTELDTIVDFTEYLRKKEELLQRAHVIATGEEDLLGCYLLNVHSFGGDSAASATVLSIDESQYRTLLGLPQFVAGKQANQQSYRWDRLIEHFIRQWRAGSLVGDVAAIDLEIALRAMAGTSRLERRSLGSLVKRVTEVPERLKLSAVMGTQDATTVFAAVNLPVPAEADLEGYRDSRGGMLLLYGRSLKLRHPSIQRAVVLGFGRNLDGQSSEDLMLNDFEDWSDEIEAMTSHDMEIFGIGAAAYHSVDHEFPIQAPRESRAQQRGRRQLARGIIRPTQ